MSASPETQLLQSLPHALKPAGADLKPRRNENGMRRLQQPTAGLPSVDPEAGPLVLEGRADLPLRGEERPPRPASLSPGQNLQVGGCAVREAALPRKLPVEPGFRRAPQSWLTAAGGAGAWL